MTAWRHLLLWLCLAFSTSWTWAQVDALLEKADAAFRSGNFQQAEALARQVLSEDPRSIHAHMILGVLAAQNKQWEASNRHFQAVVRLDPSNPHGYFYLGQAKLYQRQWEQAAQYFAKALERRYPDGERLAVEMALAQSEAGRPQQALDTLRTIQPPAEGPLAAQYHAATAFAQERLNQPRLALEAIRRARDLDDSNPQYWEFLISTLLSTDQTRAALGEAIRAQKRLPDHPDIQFLFGLTSYYVTESPLTKLALRNLREAEPDSARVLLVEGLLYRKQGHAQEATRALQSAAQRGVPDSHLLLGILCKEAGDYEGAGREYREAERLNPRNGQVLLELGKLFLIRGELNEARARLERAHEYMPANPAVHYQLGLLYRRLGETEKAEQHLRLYRELDAELSRQ